MINNVRIASYIYARAIMESTSGNYIVSSFDIADYFEFESGVTLSEEQAAKIVIELNKYNAIASADYFIDTTQFHSIHFNVYLHTDYVVNYEGEN